MALDTLLQAKLLGEPSFHFHDTPVAPTSRKAQALLGYLCTQQRPVERDHVAELLWGAGKLNNVRQALYELRQLPGAEAWLRDDTDTITVAAQSDLARFEAALGEHPPAAALTHYGGALLEGFRVAAPAFTDWLEVERARLAGLYSEARALQLDALEAEHRFVAALELARDMLQEDPLNESVHRAVMRFEHARGNSEGALEQFERCRRLIKEELGTEPLPETLALLADIEEGGAGAAKSALLISEPGDVPARPDTLVGRDAALAEARRLLDAEKRVLVHGFGGIGKTALAATLGAEVLDHGKLLWLELGQADPESALAALLRPFGAERSLAPSEHRTARIRDMLAEEGVALIILDDVWNAYSLSVLLETLPPELPLLVTSRQRYGRLKRVDVGRLDREDALELLGHFAGRDLRADDRADALCDYLGDHAYALRLAGLNLRETALSPGDLLRRVEEAPHDLRIPDSLSAQGGSVASLLKVSLEPLDDDAFEAFLAYGALFAPSATPELLALLLRRDKDRTEDALFTLVTRGLAERSATPGSDTVTYRVHDLSHAYARAVNNHRTSSVVRAARRYLEAHPNEPDVLEAELSNILGAADEADDPTLVAMMRLLTLDGHYFMARGHTNRSLTLLDRAVSLAERAHDPATAQELSGKLGDAYLNYLGQPEQARGSYEKALSLARQTGDRGREAVFLSVLGVIRFQQQAPEAEGYLQRALELAKTYASGLDLCTVLGHNGFVAGLKRDYEAVLAFSQETLALVETLAGGDSEKGGDAREGAQLDRTEISRKRFFSLNNMAQALHCLERYDASLATRQAAFALAQRQDNQIWRADALYGLGETYHAVAEREQAQRVLSEALGLYQRNGAKGYARELEAFMSTEGYNTEPSGYPTP